MFSCRLNKHTAERRVIYAYKQRSSRGGFGNSSPYSCTCVCTSMCAVLRCCMHCIPFVHTSSHGTYGSTQSISRADTGARMPLACVCIHACLYAGQSCGSNSTCPLSVAAHDINYIFEVLQQADLTASARRLFGQMTITYIGAGWVIPGSFDLSRLSRRLCWVVIGAGWVILRIRLI